MFGAQMSVIDLVSGFIDLVSTLASLPDPSHRSSVPLFNGHRSSPLFNGHTSSPHCRLCLDTRSMNPFFWTNI